MASNNDNVIATQEVAQLLGITRSAVTRLVGRGGLTPAMKLPGKTGAYLFDRSTVEDMAKAGA